MAYTKPKKRTPEAVEKWEPDWLYELIFDLVRQVWKQVMREADRFNESAAVIVYPERREPPPERFLIQEHAQGDFQHAHCRGSVVRSWMYSGKDVELLAKEPDLSVDIKREQRVGKPGELVFPYQYFVYGFVSFALSEGRNQVVFTYQLGPLYGRGYVYEVSSQWGRAVLHIARGSGSWVS